MSKPRVRLIVSVALAALFLCAAPAAYPGFAEEPAGGAEAEATPFIAFSAVNLLDDAAPVTEAVFAEADWTLVNFWATWCPPCVQELPDLGALWELSEGRVQVVGVLVDSIADYATGVLDENAISAARTLLENAGAAYPVLIPDEWLSQLAAAAVQFIPTTFIVDRNGNLADVVVGSNTDDQWLELIDALDNAE